MKKQNKYHRIPFDTFDRLLRIFLLADEVVGELASCEDTEILEKTIPRMFEAMEKVAKLSCEYVKRGHFGE